MTTTTNHNIQRLLSFLLPQRLQIITVVILAFISFLDVSVYAASSSSSTATSWNGHKQNDNNGKRQLQSERGLQLPRSTSAPASSSSSTSSSASTSTSTAPILMLDAATSYEISNDYNFHYMVTLSQPSLAAADTAANAENEPTVRFYWKVPSDLVTVIVVLVCTQNEKRSNVGSFMNRRHCSHHVHHGLDLVYRVVVVVVM